MLYGSMSVEQIVYIVLKKNVFVYIEVHVKSFNIAQ